MRNLKRVLSLALALVMVLGMMVISTSAATFADEEIAYEEAVDVMSAIGVITGDNGKFYPNRTLTREEGAAFICYMLMGKENADKLVGSGNFADVAADRWSAGEIDYCANLGIIKGYTDAEGKTVFNPKGELTAVAFGRMLLGALGYDGDIEGYTGGNWASSIAADMLEVGLNVKNVDMGAQLTREQAAQMAFQALTKTLVKYETKGTTITINGVNIVSGASSAEPQKYVEANGYDYTTGAEDADEGDTIQFCEKYFSNLSYSAADAAGKDIFGRPGHTWTYGTKPTDKLFVTDTPVLTYTTAVTGGKVYTDLGKVTVSTMTRIVNGKTTTPSDVSARIVSGNTDSFGGNGTVIEIYKISTGNYTAVAVQTFVGTIADHADAVKNADGEITTKEKVQVSAEGMTGWFDTTDFSAADKAVGNKPATTVLVTATTTDGSAYTIRSVKAVQPVVVTVSSVTAGVSFIADGETYKFSENFTGTVAYSSAPTATNQYNLWLDEYGYVIKAAAVSDAEAETGYAVVTAAAISDSAWTDGSATYEAKLIMADGTTKTVATDSASYGYLDGLTGDKVALVKYTINNKGQYVFYGTGTDQDQLADADDALALNKGVAAITTATSTTEVANAKTIFFVGTTKNNVTTYKVVTGIANMDSIVDKTETKIALLKNGTTSVVEAMVITDAQAVVDANEVKNVAFVQYNANAATTTDASGSYKVYNAVINGEITTVKVSTDYTVSGNILASSLTYGEKGLVEGVSTTFTGAASKFDAKEITTTAKDGIVTVADAGTVSVADNCVVYVVKATGITAGSIADLKDGATMSAVLTNGVVTAAFVIPAV